MKDKHAFAEAKKQLRELGISLTKKDAEYRVNFYGGTEATAYYTDDIDDAYYTGKHMSSAINPTNRKSIWHK